MKKLSAVVLGFVMMFTLSGCGYPGPQDRDGFFYETFTKNIDIAFNWLYNHVGSWGLTIVLATIILRGIVAPFMIYNYKAQREARRGQALARPELEVIQEKQKVAKEKEARAISNEDKMKARSELMELQREQMAVMKKYKAMPLSLGGCLPLLIQMPFLMGFFFVLSNPAYSTGLLDSTFLGYFNLGQRSYVLPLVAFVVYFVQMKITMKLMPTQVQPGQEAMQGQMQMMQWISPILITIVSFSVAGAVAVYYIVGGLFLIVQTYIGHAIYPPYEEEKVKKSSYDPNKVQVVSKKKKKKK